MMSQPMNEIQRRSGLLKVLTTIVFAVLFVALCTEAIGVALVDSPMLAVQSVLIFRLPVLFYLMAIWTMRRTFASISSGAMFSDVVPPMLNLIGIALFAGAVATVFIVPNLVRVLLREPASSIASFDPAAIVLGVVGLMLAILAHLLAEAADMRAELEEFF
jgi:Protein of unknown function (DUF2975)